MFKILLNSGLIGMTHNVDASGFLQSTFFLTNNIHTSHAVYSYFTKPVDKMKEYRNLIE